MNDSWRCRHGFHRFAFVEMDNRREISAWSEPAWWVCRLTERCIRCRLKRVRDPATIPRRVRISRQYPSPQEPTERMNDE